MTERLRLVAEGLVFVAGLVVIITALSLVDVRP